MRARGVGDCPLQEAGTSFQKEAAMGHYAGEVLVGEGERQNTMATGLLGEIPKSTMPACFSSESGRSIRIQDTFLINYRSPLIQHSVLDRSVRGHMGCPSCPQLDKLIQI